MQTSRGVHIEGIGLVACSVPLTLASLFRVTSCTRLANEELFCKDYSGSFLDVFFSEPCGVQTDTEKYFRDENLLYDGVSVYQDNMQA